MANRLSFSAINSYSSCGQKYFLRYKKGLRSKYFHGALAFGSSIDLALNKLLLTKDLQQAIQEFDKSWAFQWVNKKYIALSEYEDLVYAETDFDEELLEYEDKQKISEKLVLLDIPDGDVMENILDEKKRVGWSNVSLARRKFYNFCNHLSLRRKGHIMLTSYNKKVMPQIQEVLAVQKENCLKNSDGDEVVQYLDVIVKWKDGRNILMDNKTSAREYLPDSASKSPQLISYYFGAKEEYKLDAVGFLVLMKHILKNRVKICMQCGYEGTGSRHKTCSNEETGTRCNGKWKETLYPECKIDVIINNVDPIAESLVLDAFNDANKGINAGIFSRNLGACRNGPILCDYIKVCWGNDFSEVVDMSKKDDV